MITIATTGIDNVPADYVKNFLIMVAFFLGTGITSFLAYRKGKAVSGSSDDPVNIKSPIEIKKQARYAHKKDLEKLQKTVSKVVESGEERRVEILNAIHQSEHRLGDKINPVLAMVQVHEALIEQINQNIANNEAARRDEAARMHQSINDSIRIASERHIPS